MKAWTKKELEYFNRPIPAECKSYLGWIVGVVVIVVTIIKLVV